MGSSIITTGCGVPGHIKGDGDNCYVIEIHIKSYTQYQDIWRALEALKNLGD